MSAPLRALRLQEDAPGVDVFRGDVLAGLRCERKQIPYKYLYDERGSALFERICDLDEYYLTRSELSIMEQHVQEMVEVFGPRCLIIEYGSGSSRKTRLILDHLENPVAYVPIDISTKPLAESSAGLIEAYPEIEVLPVNADYTEAIRLPRPRRRPARKVVYFPGSTIGNFLPSEASAFLGRIAKVVGPAGGLLIGVDLKKDPSALEAAYADREGVTAQFTLNLLVRINRELGGDFDIDRFHHLATYNEMHGRVEIYLVSDVTQSVHVAGNPIALREGEKIHIEYSYKYDLAGFERLARGIGLRVRRVWTDARRDFSVQYLTVA
ncbi:MAG: L-histidine N(alpha)-methyltransferase [Acidobacteriota bacterium]